MKKGIAYTRRWIVLAETLPGWQTDTPGLVLAKFNPDPSKATHERWGLWHNASGDLVRSFSLRSAGEKFADLLGQSPVDWTDPNVRDLYGATQAYLLALQCMKEIA